ALVHALADAGLVPLPLVLAPHRERRRAARVEADLGVLEPRRRCALDRVDDSDAAQLASLLRFLAPLREAGVIRQLESLVHAGREIAAVVGEGERRLPRHRGRRAQTLPAPLEAVQPPLPPRAVTEPPD